MVNQIAPSSAVATAVGMSVFFNIGYSTISILDVEARCRVAIPVPAKIRSANRTNDAVDRARRRTSGFVAVTVNIADDVPASEALPRARARQGPQRPRPRQDP